MENTIIEIRGVSKRYPDQIALNHINLDIRNGEFLTLLGPSGCGKTTLLRMLAGFETPDLGTIRLDNEDITQITPEERHINIVFQNYALFPHMTVFDNIAFGLECQKLPRDEIKSRVTEIMKRVKIENLSKRKPHQLSGGQQQRVAIARAVVNEPKVLLLDEPLSALDYHLRKKLQIELKSLQRRLGITFVFVTHDQEEALSLSDRVAVMNNGDIEQLGTPRDVYEEPKNLYVAQFIGEANIFNTAILSQTGNQVEVEIAGEPSYFETSELFKAGEQVNIIIRPEDIEVWGINEVSDTTDKLHATVSEVIYKGSTVDLVVELTNGRKLFATEFFDEDDEYLNYKIGEPVLLKWKRGWEVILRDKT